MKKFFQKKEYVFGVILIGLFAFVSYISMSSIRLLQGNARVVNYVGIVRGATQKLVKEELMGWYMTRQDPSFPEKSGWYPDDALLLYLDEIVEELLSGRGSKNLVVLQDEDYLASLAKVKHQWSILKGQIYSARAGEDPARMFEASQTYFSTVNETVFFAEAYSEARVNLAIKIFIVINSVFVLLIIISLFLYLRSMSNKKKADALDKIAYADPLTGLDNRASCEREILRLKEEPPENGLAVVMFDMNDLKLTNDFFGHSGGDVLISSFAGILKNAAAGSGFVCRYGGDEFLAFFENGTAADMDEFLRLAAAYAAEYNSMRTHKLEMISFAAGYTIGSPGTGMSLEDLIHEADRRMYEDKRRVKGLM